MASKIRSLLVTSAIPVLWLGFVVSLAGAQAQPAGVLSPVTIDPTFFQQAYLKASNTGPGDSFGRRVAISGDTVVIGAHREDSNATGVNGDPTDNSSADSGAAYVFVRDGVGAWSQQAYLKASNAGSGDRFGVSVAISGDTAVIGARFEDSNATGVDGDQANNSSGSSGAAYVFVRDGTGTWSQQAYLKASNTGYRDQFGRSVSISGDTVVVGAFLEDSNADGVDGDEANNSASAAGAAYVFVRDGTGTWSQQAYLKASNSGVDDLFGVSVAISGDTAVIGAALEDSSATGVGGNQANNSASDAGATYVFVRDGMGTWSQQAYLKASNSGVGDVFGVSVAIFGDTAVIGAQREDSSATGVGGNQTNNSLTDSGAAYVFVRDGAGNWSQQAYLKASNTGSGDLLGNSVAIFGDRAVIGATREDSSSTGVGGDQTDDSSTDAGAAYVFLRDGTGTWSQQAYLKASNTGSEDHYGTVAISGDTTVIGAVREDSGSTGVGGVQADDSSTNSGAAYVFVWGSPSVGLAKSGTFDDESGDGFAQAGETISYSFAVTNTDDQTLSSVTLSDPMVSPITCPSGNPIPSLSPGVTETCTGTYSVTEADADAGSKYNTATASGKKPEGRPVSDSDTVTTTLPSSPSVGLTKSGTFGDESGDGFAQAGETISYSFAVTNTGNQTLSTITLSDPMVSPITCPSGNPIPSLSPGVTETCTGTYSVTQADVDAGSKDNTAIAEGQDPSANPISDSDTTTTPLAQAPQVSATKVSSFDLAAQDHDGTGDLTPGDGLTYTVTMTNDGSADATGVIFDDTPDPNTGLEVGSVTTTQGTVVLGNTAGDAAVRVDVGTLASGGGTALVIFEVTIDDPLPEEVTVVANQGAVSGGNFASVITDDPDSASPDDATSDEVSPALPEIQEIPTLLEWALLLLAMLLAALAARRLSREVFSRRPV